MKKMIVAFLAAACAFAGFGAATEETHVANHKWVREQFAKAGIRISTATLWRTGDVVTITAPFTSTNYPSMRKLSMTITQPKSVTNIVNTATNQVSRFSILNLFVPTAFAESTETAEYLTITVKSGYWEDDTGQRHEFNFGNGMTLKNLNDVCYDELPSDTHTCDLNSDCNCRDSLKTTSDIKDEASEEYKKWEWDEFDEEFGEWTAWISTDDPCVKALTVKGKTKYRIKDYDGQYFNLDNIDDSDVWFEAIKTLFDAINKRLDECQQNYIKAHTCGETNPQHNWQTYTCGANTWKICQRNNTHTQGTEAHARKATAESYTETKHIFKCNCGDKTYDEAHTKTLGEKTYTRDAQQHITGWTAPLTCVCGWSSSKSHTCSHKYCHACEGGDDCNLPCQTCNGSHNYTTAGEDGCAVCQCPNCSCIRSLTSMGGNPLQITEHHGGWHACANANHTETGNERGNGKHCLCDCGYNACSVTPGEWNETYGLYTGGRCAESTHSRTDLQTPIYTQIANDDAQHWAQGKSDCTRCGDKYGVRENHTWGDEETPVYKFLSNEKCALRKSCEKCAYKIYQSADQAGSHTANGNATQHTKISDSVCRSWYTCSKCGSSYYVDGEHVKDTNNGCKCQKCGDFQFEHNYNQTDACGNNYCACGKFESEKTHEKKATAESYTAQNHIFKCKCGEKTYEEAHAPTLGEKTYTRDAQQHITGWTAPITCVCGWSSSKSHTCSHKYCHACEGGDECTLPCQTCNGSHNYTTAGEDGCAVCQCPNCGCIRTMTTQGGSPVQAVEHHGGWHACANDNHEEEGNERGNGKHCLCDCGYNACSMTPGEWNETYGLYTGGRCAESTHSRTDLDDPTYEQIANDDTQHWSQGKSNCTRCGDKYGVKENHSWGDEDIPVYKYLSNEKCALRKTCEKCAYKIFQSAEEAGAHTHSGNADQYSKISDSVCRAWYTCSQCASSYYEDGEHVRDTSNGCKCQKCKDYQFAHNYNQTDACGNKSCACGKADPNANEQHINHTDKGNGTHACACGKEVKDHVWGGWVKTGTLDGRDYYKANCTVCNAEKTTSVPVNTPPEICTASNHVPLSETCGCQCGKYTPGATYTNANNQAATGTASSEDRFHAYGVTDGVTNCICKCGTKHKFVEWTRAEKEALTSYPASFCPVCRVCKVRDRSGNAVQESEHVSRDRYGAHAGCGCKCGKYGSDATLVAFHPKHPSTCRCYGQSGNGDGIWHYPNARTDCIHVCAYTTNGVMHKANTGNAAVAEANAQTTWEDHTRKATDCGCKCGSFTHENVTAEMDTLHYMAYNKCVCECEKTTIEHDPKRGPGATATKKDSTLHTLTNACKRCGIPCYADESSHGFEYHSIEKVPANASTHRCIKDCTHGVQALAGCGYSVTNSAPHLFSTNWYFQDQTWHIVSNICNVATDALNPPCGYRKSSREQHTNYDHGWIMMNATHCYPDVWCRKCNCHVKYDVARASAHDFSTSTEDWHTCIRCGYTGAHTWGEPSAIGSYGNHQKCTICNRVKILPNE